MIRLVSSLVVFENLARITQVSNFVLHFLKLEQQEYGYGGAEVDKCLADNRRHALKDRSWITQSNYKAPAGLVLRERSIKIAKSWKILQQI